MNVSLKHVAALAVAAVLGTATTSQAVGILKSGDTVDGWQITFPAGISLVDDGGSHLTLEKTAVFFTNTLPLTGLKITFNQVSYSASSTITIADETLTNKSNAVLGTPGIAWSGFDFLLENAGAPNPAAFTGAFFTSTPPFGNVSKSADTIALSGGIVPPGGTVNWGFDGPGGPGGDLVIAAHPATSGITKVFDLKELPIAGVPLPTAAWSGLTGLVGLGLIGSAKKVKKILA